MAFDPDKPITNSRVASAELRDNFVALAQHHRGSQASGDAQLGWVWLDTSDSDNWLLKVYTRHGDGSSSWKTLFDHAERTPAAGSDVEQSQVLYVGKHGSDSNNGKTPGRSFLTFGAAITAAGTPANEAAAVTIVCLDDGAYTENLTLVSYVNTYAPRARLVGSLTVADYVTAQFRQIYFNNASGATVSKTAGTNLSVVRADRIESAGGAFAVQVAYANVLLQVESSDIYSDAQAALSVQRGAILRIYAGNIEAVGAIRDVIETWNGAGEEFYIRAHILRGGRGILNDVSGSVVGHIDADSIVSDQGFQVNDNSKVVVLAGEIESTTRLFAVDDCELYITCSKCSGTREYAGTPLVRVTEAKRDNYVATGAPGANDDTADGYTVGSIWVNVTADDAYICCDSTAGSAVWKKITP